MTVANICHSFAPKFYDKKRGEWIDNPNGTQNSALYIGTEMELVEEIEPIIWAYMADVPEDHITQNRYEPGEEERVDKAWEILHDESTGGGIYMEYVPEYDIATLEAVIEQHVVEHHVTSVFFDYIHTTTNLLSEFQGAAKGKMTIREDQILGNLSSKLKELTRKYNISIDTWTQVTGDFKNDKNRDQTIVRGSKAIIDKCDVAMIMSRPTTKERKFVESYYRAVKKLRSDIDMPNVCISVYKNRGGKMNEIKIWLYVDYSTMRVHDLFVTNYDYELLDVEKEVVYVDEDKKLHVFKSSADLDNFRIQAIKNMSSIDDKLDESENEENTYIPTYIDEEKQDKINPVDDVFVALDDYGETTEEKAEAYKDTEVIPTDEEEEIIEREDNLQNPISENEINEKNDSEEFNESEETKPIVSEGEDKKELEKPVAVKKQYGYGIIPNDDDDDFDW